jgi:formyltetrahydrofolate deformylase
MKKLAQSKYACLRIHGPDEKGILAANSHLLDKFGCSIIKTEQYTDPQLNHFYQRYLFYMSSYNHGFHHDSKMEIEYELSQLQNRFGLQLVKVDWRDVTKKMAVFVSKYDHCLWEILLRHKAKELDCNISAVVSNHPDLRSVVEAFGIPFHVFPIQEGNKRMQEEKEIRLLKDDIKVDLIVLARYMQVLSGTFLGAFEPDQIINIHHSFLPAFKGAHPYQKAYERGVKLVGATVSVNECVSCIIMYVVTVCWNSCLTIIVILY